MKIQSGSFKVGMRKVEEFYLSGDYEIKTVPSKYPLKKEYLYGHIDGQMIYDIGNVLYRTETQDIDDMINIFIRYTNDPCLDLNLDLSVQNVEVIIDGTICPSKKILFAYKDKVYVAYGRYIFGFDSNFEVLQRHTNDEDENWKKVENSECVAENLTLSWDERPKRADSINNDEIVINNPKEGDGDYYEYIFSFMIYDQHTKVLDAFGLYW